MLTGIAEICLVAQGYASVAQTPIRLLQNTRELAKRFRRDGVVVVENAVTPAWTNILIRTVDAGFAVRPFVWRLGPAFARLALDSGLADLASAFLRGPVILFYDEFLEKLPGDIVPTPWHVDCSYWPVQGRACSIWLALDPVDAANGGTEYVAGSHVWNRRFRPTSVRQREAWCDAPGEDIPDIDGARDQYRLFSKALRVGDAIAHDASTVHRARGNPTARRRRAYITRWLSADAREGSDSSPMALPKDLRAFADYPRWPPK
jgi:hypothetical protein